MSQTHQQVGKTIIGEPEVLEDTLSLAHGVERTPAWLDLKAAATAFQALQIKDGSVPEATDHAQASELVERMVAAVRRRIPDRARGGPAPLARGELRRS